MNKPTLVIMAAGMGSRYGGLKQIDAIQLFTNLISVFMFTQNLKRSHIENPSSVDFGYLPYL